jgi:hypothetical protein
MKPADDLGELTDAEAEAVAQAVGNVGRRHQAAIRLHQGVRRD